MNSAFLRGWLAVLMSLLFAGAVHAQQVPGVNCVPIQGQGWQGCAPTGNGHAAQVEWETHWGAIATDDIKGVVTSSNTLSESSATAQALAACKAKGGMQCKTELAYANSCGAMILGDKHHYISSDTTLKKAEARAMHNCVQQGDTHCYAFYNLCAFPVAVQ